MTNCRLLLLQNSDELEHFYAKQRYHLAEALLLSPTGPLRRVLLTIYLLRESHMSSVDEAARILDEGFPADIPNWDLTDDFLRDVGQFLDTSLPNSPLEMVHDYPVAPVPADQVERLPDNSTPALEPALSSDGPSPTQRKLQSNRLAQARARQRKKVVDVLQHVACTNFLRSSSASLNGFKNIRTSVWSRHSRTACIPSLLRQQLNSEL